MLLVFGRGRKIGMYLGKNDSLRLEFIGKNLFDYMVGNDQKATLMPL